MTRVPVIHLLPLISKIHSLPSFVILDLDTVDIPVYNAGSHDVRLCCATVCLGDGERTS